MTATINYIDASERTFIQGAVAASIIGTTWKSDGSLEGDAIIYQDAEFGSLRLEASATNHYLYYNIWDDPALDEPSQFAISTPFDNEDYVEAFCWVRTTHNATFRISTQLTKVVLDTATQTYMLSTNPADTFESGQGVHVVAAGLTDSARWHLLRSVRIQIPDGDDKYSLAVKIDIDNGNASATYHFSRPTIITSYAILDNRFMQDVCASMPQVFFEQDKIVFDSNSPSFPFLRIIDIATTVADDINDKIESIRYNDIEGGKSLSIPSTLSQLVVPDIAETRTLFWLAQFRGRDLLVTYEPSTEGEPWELFVLDVSTLDGTSVLGTTELVGTIPGGVEEFYRWQVETAAYGHNAGTISSMISAIQLLLSGNKFIDYTVGTNTIHFETYYTETFGATLADVGTESPFIIQVLEPTRPMGMVITHEIIAP